VNKLLYIAFLVTWMTASSQDSLVVDTTTVAKIIFTEKDIQIDSLSMEARSFETTIKEKY